MTFCAICKNKTDIDNNNNLISKPSINSLYISTKKEFINKAICDYEFESEEGIIGLYKNHNLTIFPFLKGIVLNAEAIEEHNINVNELKNICDISKNVERAYGTYFINKTKIGNLLKVLEEHNHINYILNIENMLINWNKPSYTVSTSLTSLSVFVYEKDKKLFKDLNKY